MDKNHVLEKLRQLTEELGRRPTPDEFMKVIPRLEIRKSFTSFEDLLAAAGVFIPRPKRKRNLAPYLNTPGVISPLIPPDDIPIEDIIRAQAERFKQRKLAHDAHKWMKFKVLTDLPIGINWFGDPHLDDDGCNWPLLLEHIEICKTVPGVFGANIGDTHNNWVGRLMAEYANQSITRGTAFKMIEWFFKDAGINWIVMLLGNHDDWNMGAETLKKIAQNVCPMVDWRAQFKLEFANGFEFLIDAAHNHAGHSQWNSLHAQQKASSMGGIADLYIAGHLHNWAIAMNECPQTNRIYGLARARGYKQIDHYGEKLGFGSQKFGASIMTVIDPKANPVNKLRLFADPREGADYLTYLRSRR